MTNEDKEKIKELFKAGVRTIEIAEKFNVSRQYIHLIVGKKLMKKKLDKIAKKRKIRKDKKEKELTIYNKNLALFRAGKRWSIAYPCCIDCGRTKIKHSSKGRCLSCYSGFKYKTDPKRRVMQNKCTRNWMKDNPERTREIMYKASKKYNKKLKSL